MAAGRQARARGEASATAFATALDLYTGDLLPEEGPAEWVAARRDQVRARAIEAATSLAEESLLVEDLPAVVRACRFGLGLDRYQDGAVADADRGARARRRGGRGHARAARVRAGAAGARASPTEVAAAG